jgi:hypothetical protein
MCNPTFNFVNLDVLFNHDNWIGEYSYVSSSITVNFESLVKTPAKTQNARDGACYIMPEFKR